MKTLQEKYNLIKEGKGDKALFLKEAKRTFPHLISNLNNFSDTEKILKNKSIINEEFGGIVTLKPLVQLTSKILTQTNNLGKLNMKTLLMKKELNP